MMLQIYQKNTKHSVIYSKNLHQETACDNLPRLFAQRLINHQYQKSAAEMNLRRFYFKIRCTLSGELGSALTNR